MTDVSLPHQLTRTRRFSLGAPSRFTVAPDRRTVFFLRSRDGADPVACLWAIDARTGEERLLADPRGLLAGAAERLSPEERTRRERSRQRSAGIVDYAADDACELLAFALSSRLWTVRPASGEVRALGTAEPVLDPRPDPTGRRIAYVSGGALRVVAADGSTDRVVLAADGRDVGFGLAEHVAGESMGRHRGYWRAPDGGALLVARVDTSAVQRWYVSDPADPARPPATIAYPAAGTPNADVSLWLARVDGAAGPVVRVEWDTAAFEYLTAAGWDPSGPYAAVQDRSQRHVVVLGIDAASGGTEVLAERRDDAWVTLVPGLPARTGRGALLTCADLDGTRRLLVDGAPVTPPGLQLRAVLDVDGDTVLFAASDEPTELHLWTYDPAAGPQRLTDEPGVHGGTLRAGTLVVTSLTEQGDGADSTIRRDAAAPVPIPSHAERPVLEPRWELLRLGPRELRAALFLPSWYRDGDGPLPVLMDPYGGPAAAKAVAARTSLAYVSQWFAEQGFAVLVVDGRGTPGRGPAWERTIHLDVAGPVLDDQVAGLHAAAELRPALDLTRVAIRGWSFGGYLAALAVLRRPDVFHAGVAGAPVTDHRLYDTHWRERHLGHPDEHPEAYDRCSLIADAASLRRPLLLVHGLADDNVFAAHTLRFSAALLAAGRPHEMLPLSATTHAPAAENLLPHQLDFLRRALGLARPNR